VADALGEIRVLGRSKVLQRQHYQTRHTHCFGCLFVGPSPHPERRANADDGDEQQNGEH
jgi:hypothetical protein